jgi:hypothetical protein
VGARSNNSKSRALARLFVSESACDFYKRASQKMVLRCARKVIRQRALVRLFVSESVCDFYMAPAQICLLSCARKVIRQRICLGLLHGAFSNLLTELCS